MAACTSRAAPSMSRLMSNCSTTWVEPTELREVICVTSAMAPRCRSSGVATVFDITSGLAPAMLALTTMVGRSMFGSGATGIRNSALNPASAIPIANRVVAMGRLVKIATTFMPLLSRGGCGGGPTAAARAPFAQLAAPAVEIDIDHWRGEKRQELADQKAAHDGDAQRMAQFRAHAGAHHQRQRAEQGRHRGHQNGAETQKRRLMNGLGGGFALVAFGFQREVDHHDRVFLNDTDQENDADNGNDVEVVAGDN